MKNSLSAGGSLGDNAGSTYLPSPSYTRRRKILPKHYICLDNVNDMNDAFSPEALKKQTILAEAKNVLGTLLGATPIYTVSLLRRFIIFLDHCISKSSTCSLDWKNRGRRKKWCLCSAIFFAVFIIVIFIPTAFVINAKKRCRAPSPSKIAMSLSKSRSKINKPMVEYYVHGRGNGHFSRSVAIIDRLNQDGVDVRMFTGRADTWMGLNDADEGVDKKDGVENRKGSTTAISVTSMTPEISCFRTLSLLVERIMGDCKVSHQTGRFPDLVVSDGDFPGMLRAWLGSIPIISISHGQTFAESVMPKWIDQIPNGRQAWMHQKVLNKRAAYFSDWQIGTNFVIMDTERDSAVITKSPTRSEVKNIAETRRYKTELLGERHARNVTVISNSSKPVDLEAFAQINSSRAVSHQSRKVVMCYFRDKNGHDIVTSLVNAGFDVVLFGKKTVKMDIKAAEKKGLSYRRISYQSYHKIPKRKDRSTTLDLIEMEHLNFTHVRHSTDISEGTDVSSLKFNAVNRNNEIRKSSGLYVKGAEQSNKLNHDPSSFAEASDDVPQIYHREGALFLATMENVDGVVASAGSQTMSECIHSKIPLLALYKENDSEQMLNVEMGKREYPNLIFGVSFEQFESESMSGILKNDNILNHPKRRSYLKGSQQIYENTNTNILNNEYRSDNDFASFVEKIRKSSFPSSLHLNNSSEIDNAYDSSHKEQPSFRLVEGGKDRLLSSKAFVYQNNIKQLLRDEETSNIEGNSSGSSQQTHNGVADAATVVLRIIRSVLKTNHWNERKMF